MLNEEEINAVRQLILLAKLNGNEDEARRIQDKLCEEVRRCELCRVCRGWKTSLQGTNGWRRKYEV